MRAPAADMSECRVQLRRDTVNTPWGFRLQGGHEYGSPLVVQRVSITRWRYSNFLTTYRHAYEFNDLGENFIKYRTARNVAQYFYLTWIVSTLFGKKIFYLTLT